MNAKKISSFTGLRFIMIMLIVLTHFDGMIQHLGAYGALHHKYTFEFFMLAVDFFFLLSGFGMMFSYLNRVSQDELKLPQLTYGVKYAINHVKKIYPAYIGTIIFGIVIVLYKAAFVYHILSLEIIIKGILRIIVNVSLLQSATGMAYFTHAYNGAAWFLSSLFCIYIVSPYIMYFLRTKSKNYVTDILFIVLNLIIIMVLNHYLSLLETKLNGIKGIPDVDNLVYASPYRRIFYVIIGMNVSMIVNRLDRESFLSEKAATILEILITIVAVVYYSLIRTSIAQYFWTSIIEMCIVASVLFIFSFDKGIISKFLGLPFMQALGNMAMYIFLIHFAIIHHFFTVVYDAWGWTFVSVYSFIAVILVLTFSISWLLYKHDIRKKELKKGE